MSKDAQKKTKRKGRNKQEFLTVNPAEPEPETVKTPIDLLKVIVYICLSMFDWEKSELVDCHGFS